MEADSGEVELPSILRPITQDLINIVMIAIAPRMTVEYEDDDDDHHHHHHHDDDDVPCEQR